MATRLPKDYAPDSEPFMNARQREYFRQACDLERRYHSGNTRNCLFIARRSLHLPDVTDRAASESEKTLELRTRDRQRKLINKIDAALGRLEDQTYGYCEETGDPISLKRLDARQLQPLAWKRRKDTKNVSAYFATTKFSAYDSLAWLVISFKNHPFCE